MPFTVVLVDDHQVLRDAIKEILLRHPEFGVVGEAGSGPEAVEICRQSDPDLVVMDIGLPGMNGIEATGELARLSPRARVLILSMYDDEGSVMAAVRAGARGFVLKQACASELVRQGAAGAAVGPGRSQDENSGLRERRLRSHSL